MALNLRIKMLLPERDVIEVRRKGGVRAFATCWRCSTTRRASP